MDTLRDSNVPALSLDFINKDHTEAAALIRQIDQVIHELHQTDLGFVDELSELLSSLFKTQRDHFMREEQAMANAGYPAFHIHKQEHNRLLNELTSLMDHWKKYQDIDSVALYMREIFPNWFSNHIKQMDRVCADYISSR